MGEFTKIYLLSFDLVAQVKTSGLNQESEVEVLNWINEKILDLGNPYRVEFRESNIYGLQITKTKASLVGFQMNVASFTLSLTGATLQVCASSPEDAIGYLENSREWHPQTYALRFEKWIPYAINVEEVV